MYSLFVLCWHEGVSALMWHVQANIAHHLDVPFEEIWAKCESIVLLVHPMHMARGCSVPCMQSDVQF